MKLRQRGLELSWLNLEHDHVALPHTHISFFSGKRFPDVFCHIFHAWGIFFAEFCIMISPINRRAGGCRDFPSITFRKSMQGMMGRKKRKRNWTDGINELRTFACMYAVFLPGTEVPRRELQPSDGLSGLSIKFRAAVAVLNCLPRCWWWMVPRSESLNRNYLTGNIGKIKKRKLHAFGKFVSNRSPGSRGLDCFQVFFPAEVRWKRKKKSTVHDWIFMSLFILKLGKGFWKVESTHKDLVSKLRVGSCSRFMRVGASPAKWGGDGQYFFVLFFFPLSASHPLGETAREIWYCISSLPGGRQISFHILPASYAHLPWLSWKKMEDPQLLGLFFSPSSQKFFVVDYDIKEILERFCPTRRILFWKVATRLGLFFRGNVLFWKTRESFCFAPVGAEVVFSLLEKCKKTPKQVWCPRVLFCKEKAFDLCQIDSLITELGISSSAVPLSLFQRTCLITSGNHSICSFSILFPSVFHLSKGTNQFLSNANMLCVVPFSLHLSVRVQNYIFHLTPWQFCSRCGVVYRREKKSRHALTGSFIFPLFGSHDNWQLTSQVLWSVLSRLLPLIFSEIFILIFPLHGSYTLNGSAFCSCQSEHELLIMLCRRESHSWVG